MRATCRTSRDKSAQPTWAFRVLASVQTIRKPGLDYLDWFASTPCRIDRYIANDRRTTPDSRREPQQNEESHFGVDDAHERRTGPQAPIVFMTAGAPFDPHALHVLVEDLGDHTIAVSVVEHYLAELDQREQAVREAASSGSHDTLHRIGHTMRSTSEMMGVLEIRDLCRELEATTEATDSAELAERFSATAEPTRDILRAWLTDQH